MWGTLAVVQFYPNINHTCILLLSTHCNIVGHSSSHTPSCVLFKDKLLISHLKLNRFTHESNIVKANIGDVK